MTPLEALDKIKYWVEYITRLDYVEPIVRGEVQTLLYNAYHRTTEEFDLVEKSLEALKDLFTNHIELVEEKDRCYFKIKNSEGKEKSFTSHSWLDFWKEVLQ